MTANKNHLGTLFNSKSGNQFDFFTLVLPLYPIAILGFGAETNYFKKWVAHGISGFTLVILMVVGLHNLSQRKGLKNNQRNTLFISLIVAAISSILSYIISPDLWSNEYQAIFFHFARNVIWIFSWTILAMKVKSSARNFFRMEKLIEAQRIHEARVAIIQEESIRKILANVEINVKREFSDIFIAAEEHDNISEKVRNLSHDIFLNSEMIAADYHKDSVEPGARRSFLFYSFKSLRYITINNYAATFLFGAVYLEVLGLRSNLIEFFYAAAISASFLLSLELQKMRPLKAVSPPLRFVFFGLLQIPISHSIYLLLSHAKSGLVSFHFPFQESITAAYLYFLIVGYFYLFQAGRMQSKELQEAYFDDLVHTQYENRIIKGELVHLLRDWSRVIHGPAQAKALQIEAMLGAHTESTRANARLVVYQELDTFLDSLRLDQELDSRPLAEILNEYISPWRSIVEIELKLHEADESKVSFEDRSRIAAVVQDGIVNAFRHGEAKRIMIRLYSSPNHHHLEMKNDGAQLRKNEKRKPGLGSQNFDFVSSGAWSLSNVDEYVVLKVAFPIARSD